MFLCSTSLSWRCFGSSSQVEFGRLGMTFDKYCKAIKENLCIEALTEVDAKRIMSLYLTRVPVEKAIEMMKEK